MTEIATIDWFGRWVTSVFPENTAYFCHAVVHLHCNLMFGLICLWVK